MSRQPSREELRLLGLAEGASFPEGGDALQLTVKSGCGQGHVRVGELQPFFPVPLFNGTFNLWSSVALEWPSPKILPIGTQQWDLCPIIVEETVLGVAATGGRGSSPTFLEIFSPVGMRAALGDVEDFAPVRARLLRGELLRL